MEEKTGGWRKQLNEQFCDLYCPNGWVGDRVTEEELDGEHGLPEGKRFWQGTVRKEHWMGE